MEPRQTPTYEANVPEDLSGDGEMACELATAYFGDPLPWQPHLLDAMLARDARDKYLLRTLGISIPRQNGKSWVVRARCFYGALNGEKMDGVKLIKALNKLGGENGIGIYDVVENRLVGMKSRGVYETPGGTILYHAHEVLETICLDKETQHYKAGLAQKYADIVYNGQWYTPLREAMDAFVDKTQETVNGDVKLKLYKGNIILSLIHISEPTRH